MKDSGGHDEKLKVECYTDDAKNLMCNKHLRKHIHSLFPLAYNDRQYGNLKSPQCKIQTISKVNIATNFWFTLKLLTIFLGFCKLFNEQTTLNKST